MVKGLELPLHWGVVGRKSIGLNLYCIYTKTGKQVCTAATGGTIGREDESLGLSVEIWPAGGTKVTLLLSIIRNVTTSSCKLIKLYTWRRHVLSHDDKRFLVLSCNLRSNQDPDLSLQCILKIFFPLTVRTQPTQRILVQSPSGIISITPIPW